MRPRAACPASTRLEKPVGDGEGDDLPPPRSWAAPTGGGGRRVRWIPPPRSWAARGPGCRANLGQHSPAPVAGVPVLDRPSGIDPPALERYFGHRVLAESGSGSGVGSLDLAY